MTELWSAFTIASIFILMGVLIGFQIGYSRGRLQHCEACGRICHGRTMGSLEWMTCQDGRRVCRNCQSDRDT